MNKIHEKSDIATISDLDIFVVPPTQESVQKTYYTEHRPLSILNYNQQIQFSIQSSEDEYINLRDTLFYIKFKVNLGKTGNVSADDWKKVIPVQNMMHSMFKNVHLDIDNKNISKSPQTYAYKAYFENLLGYTETAKAGVMTSEGWIVDYDAHMKTFNGDYSKKIVPSPVTTDGKGKSVEFCGKLHLDLAMQPKSLIGGCKLMFTLIPNDPNFYLWVNDDNLSVSVDFEDAGLYISRSKVIDPIVYSHNKVMEKSNAKYPIMRGVVKSFPISQGASEVNIDNAIVGQIPRRIFISLVDSRGFNGDKKFNPYNFEHFDVNHLSASLDGEMYPSIAFKPDFKKNLYVKEFIGLYDALNALTTDSPISISYEDFRNGSAIFGVVFGADPADDCNKSGYVNPVKKGAINLNMKFGTAIANNINVLIYCEYDNMIQIDNFKTPYCDFT